MRIHFILIILILTAVFLFINNNPNKNRIMRIKGTQCDVPLGGISKETKDKAMELLKKMRYQKLVFRKLRVFGVACKNGQIFLLEPNLIP